MDPRAEPFVNGKANVARGNGNRMPSHPFNMPPPPPNMPDPFVTGIASKAARKQGQYFNCPPMPVPDIQSLPRIPMPQQPFRAQYNMPMPQENVRQAGNSYVTNPFANQGNGKQPMASIDIYLASLDAQARAEDPEYRAEAGGSDCSTGTDRTVRPPPPPQMPNKPFRTTKSVYEVIITLQPPSSDPMRMSDGVELVKHHTGQLLVHKRLRITNTSQEARAEAERAALKQVVDAGGHPNINRLHECFSELPGSIYFHLVMEHCDNGSLYEYIENSRHRPALISERFCWHVLFGMASALAMCHFGVRNPLEDQTSKLQHWNTLCHLDIKPANVFLSSKNTLDQDFTGFPTVVIGDFGCVVTRSDIIDKRIPNDGQPFGTPGWFPPENRILADGTPSGKYGKPTDIWQAGAVIQALCMKAKEPDQNTVGTGLPCDRGYSRELNMTVAKMMTRDITMRPSAVDVAKEVRSQQDGRGYI